MVCKRCQNGQHNLCAGVAALHGIRGITWCDCQHKPVKADKESKGQELEENQ